MAPFSPLPVPAGIVHPPAVWLYNVAIPIAGISVFALFTWQSIKRRSFTWWWLFFVAGALCWWQETFGDWGQYLVYSPKFWSYHLPFRHTSAHNPIFMPWAYGLYWGVHAVLVLRLAGMLSRRTGWRRGWCIALLAAPVGFCWDLTVEGIATHFGWWTYDPPLGPSFHSGAGIQPLVVPMVIMFTWPNLVAWLGGDPRDEGVSPIERLFRLDRLRRPAAVALPVVESRELAGAVTLTQSRPVAAIVQAPAWQPRFELARLAAWLVSFQLSFFVLLVVPLVVLRMTIGHPSIYIP
jgi:hypothetical protein